MRIVLVEDNVRVANVTSAMLGALGHDVRVFTLTADALAYLRSNSDYDVILTDFHLADMSALDLLGTAEIKANAGVIVYTGSGELERVEDAFQGRVVGLHKPFNFPALAGAIDRSVLLSQRP